MVPVSEPMAAAWSKAVAAGATLLVAGVGAGVAPHGGGKPPALKPDSAKPAAAHTRSATPARGTRVRRPLAVAPRKRAVVKSKSRTGGKRQRLARQVASAARRRARATPARRGAPTGGSTKPAATNPTGSTPNPTRGVHAPTGGRPGDDAAPSLPKVTLPRSRPAVGSTQVGGAVEQTVNDVTGAVNDGGRGRAGHGRRRDGRAAHAVVSRRG